MGQFTGVSLKLLPPKKLFSMTSTILIGQWPNLLTFRGGEHASATPLESDKMATSAKKAKTKSRYRNKFKTEWSAEFPGIVSSKGNTEKARCVYSGTDFVIGHGGRSDVKRHVETEGRRNAVVDAKQTGRHVRLSEMRYPPRANATLDEKVARAEALWCKFVLQVNATMTCELREKKQLPATMLQSSRKMRVMTSRVSYKDICFHSLCNFVA